MTCRELASLWTTRYPRPSETSNAQHARSVREWGEHFGDQPLREHTREQAREWGLAHPWQVRYLRGMFFDALRDGLVDQNPYAALRISPPRRERYFPSTEEVEDLIRAAEEPLRGRIRFAAYVGPRLGELLALRPCDFELPQVHICAQIGPEGKRKPPKGKIKDRWAFVPPDAWAENEVSLPLLATTYEWEDPLWPIPRHVHTKEWRKLRRSLKLPENFVWHSLRHHAATWFLDQGASFEDVAIQLGHSDEGVMVREVYGHRDRGKALDRLEALVG